MRIKIRSGLFLLFGFQGVLQVIYWELIKGYPACFMCKGYRVLYLCILVATLVYRYHATLFRLLFVYGLILIETLWSVWDVGQKLGQLSQKCNATAGVVEGNLVFVPCSSNMSSVLNVLGSPVGLNALLSLIMLGYGVWVMWKIKPSRLKNFRWSVVLIGVCSNESIASSRTDGNPILKHAAQEQQSKRYEAEAKDLCDASEVEAKKYEAQARKIGIPPSQEVLAEVKKIIHEHRSSHSNKGSCNGKCPSFQPTSDMEQSLQVCMSFSVPTQVWKELNEDLIRHQGVFVVKGLPNNSFQAFAAKVLEFRKQGITAPIRMDPKLFERLKIHQVPLFVVNEGNETHTVSGTLSIPYVIDLMHINTGAEK